MPMIQAPRRTSAASARPCSPAGKVQRRLGAALCALTLWAGLTAGSTMAADTPAGDGRAVLEASLPDVTGKKVRVADIGARVWVINFWATWCPPCRNEIPDLIAVHEAYKDRGAQVVGIAIEQPEPIPDFVKAYKMSYPVLVDRAEGLRLMREVGNNIGALPYTVVLDKDGRILMSKRGVVSRGRLETALNEALK